MRLATDDLALFLLGYQTVSGKFRRQLHALQRPQCCGVDPLHGLLYTATIHGAPPCPRDTPFPLAVAVVGPKSLMPPAGSSCCNDGHAAAAAAAGCVTLTAISSSQSVVERIRKHLRLCVFISCDSSTTAIVAYNRFHCFSSEFQIALQHWRRKLDFQ